MADYTIGPAILQIAQAIELIAAAPFATILAAAAIPGLACLMAAIRA